MSPRQALLILAAILAAGGAGCGGKRPRTMGAKRPPMATQASAPTTTAPTDGVTCLFDARDLDALGVKRLGRSLTSGAGAGAGALLLEADGLVHDTRTWAPLGATPLETPASIAADGRGIVYAVSGSRFGFISAGAFSPLTTLPAPGYSVAVAPTGVIHLYGPGADGGGLVFRLRRDAEGKSLMRQLVATSEPIVALDAIGDDVVFASGNRLFRAGLVDGERGAVVLLAALAREAAIRSVAADPERGAIYLATDERTFLFADGAVTPILDIGGQLLLRGEHHDRLVVLQPDQRRAFDVDLPQLGRALARPAPAAPAP